MTRNTTRKETKATAVHYSPQTRLGWFTAALVWFRTNLPDYHFWLIKKDAPMSSCGLKAALRRSKLENRTGFAARQTSPGSRAPVIRQGRRCNEASTGIGATLPMAKASHPHARIDWSSCSPHPHVLPTWKERGVGLVSKKPELMSHPTANMP